MEEAKNHHEHYLNASFSKGKKKLSLESYYGVLASGNYNSLTHGELNKIFSIHGFKQLKNGKKIELVEAVRTLEPKDFSRSTIHESIQPAPMSLTDVIKDLTQLNWQTCPVASVRSIDLAHYNNTASSTCNPRVSVNPAGIESEKKKTKKATSKRKQSGQSDRSREQAGSVVNESSTCAPMVVIALKRLITASEEEQASRQRSCVQSGIKASGGGDITSCSSLAMAEEIQKPENKKKRKLNKESLEELLSCSI